MAQGTERSRHVEVGQRIRRGRLRTGLSLEKFAPLVGITRRHLIRLENGENLPRPKLAARIEEVLAEQGQPVKEPILGDVTPPFGSPREADVAAALLAAVRQILRDEFGRDESEVFA